MAVAERGGVIGGASAGAMIQGTFLLNVTKTPSDLRFSRSGMFLDRARTTGFGLLRDVAVYPHVDARGSARDLAELVGRYPNLLGIGIDENTAIVVRDDQFDVIGRGHVTIVDTTGAAKTKSETLSKGQHFDLRTRIAR